MSLLHGGDEDLRLRTTAERILEAVEVFVDGISRRVEFKRRDHFNVSLILRCITKKTQESLVAILELAKNDRAYYAMPLLRPMCEELLFARFLKSLPREEADEYLWDKVHLDVLEGLRAQRNFFDNVQHPHLSDESLGAKFPPHPKELQDLSFEIDELTKKMKDFGKEHGWGKRTSPTVKYMAEVTDSLDEYEFFYHATSDAVHANLHHLARMVWGNIDEGMSITNANFDTYYRRFVLTYGTWLTTLLVDETREEFVDHWPEEIDSDYRLWRDFLIEVSSATRFPPIVTEEELRWRR